MWNWLMQINEAVESITITVSGGLAIFAVCSWIVMFLIGVQELWNNWLRFLFK